MTLQANLHHQQYNVIRFDWILSRFVESWTGQNYLTNLIVEIDRKLWAHKHQRVWKGFNLIFGVLLSLREHCHVNMMNKYIYYHTHSVALEVAQSLRRVSAGKVSRWAWFCLIQALDYACLSLVSHWHVAQVTSVWPYSVGWTVAPANTIGMTRLTDLVLICKLVDIPVSRVWTTLNTERTISEVSALITFVCPLKVIIGNDFRVSGHSIGQIQHFHSAKYRQWSIFSMANFRKPKIDCEMLPFQCRCSCILDHSQSTFWCCLTFHRSSVCYSYWDMYCCIWSSGSWCTCHFLDPNSRLCILHDMSCFEGLEWENEFNISHHRIHV